MRHAVEWWRELDFDRRQRMNVIGRRFFALHSIEIFATLPRERDVFYQPAQDV